jgi:hypothetical protein
MEEAREGEIKLDAVARPVELSKWVPDLNMGGPEITLTTLVSLKPQLITVNGQTKLDGLTMTGEGRQGRRRHEDGQDRTHHLHRRR